MEMFSYKQHMKFIWVFPWYILLIISNYNANSNYCHIGWTHWLLMFIDS